ncbi:hypothetical protein LCGC14_2436760 [marine sediment metagenome]|uniref:Uncharacterized protein n=1 Tax=marine sediment metagenome TaxID=412755 RepID=A0A0F9DX99_9ZZZZ
MKLLKITALVLMTFILLSCIPDRTVKKFSLNGWDVIYNDRDKMLELCGGWTVGCADIKNKVIYSDSDDDFVIIREGLSEGDLIISYPVMGLMDGMKITHRGA